MARCWNGYQARTHAEFVTAVRKWVSNEQSLGLWPENQDVAAHFGISVEEAESLRKELNL